MAWRTPGRSVYRVIWIQLIVTAVVAGAAAIHGTVVTVSVLAGALNSLVPNAYFARRVLRASAGDLPRMVLGKWFRAELGKLAMIAGLFVVAFAFIEKLNVLALFTGFLCVHLSGVVASLFLDPYGGDQNLS
ncbi:MAG: ATP synthase subunit I [Gammaproteobacteria bacterium]|nr:ATP synthase subunit I [Gammaproteobacteria bacterium]